MINILLALALVADERSSLADAIQRARIFLQDFSVDPKSVSALATGDAVFATIDNSGPLAEVLDQIRDRDSILAHCSLGPITAQRISEESVRNLPANSFKQSGQFVEAVGSYICPAPNGKTMKAQAQLVIKDGKIAFFGIYSSP